MTWVRSDDQASIHRKVAPLDDATYRLWREAMEWCGRNLTNGIIRADELDSTSKRGTPGRAARLVERTLWHEAGQPCHANHPPTQCPPAGPDGWVMHDYFDYQPSRAQVLAEKEAKARRQQNWRDRKRGASRNASTDTSHDPPQDGPVTPAPTPPPSPPRRDAGTGSPSTTRGRPCPSCGNPPDSPYHRNVCAKAS